METDLKQGHFVYIVECNDRTLYTGYTVDVEKRLAEHNAGKAAKYTRGRTPVTLRYVEEGESRSWGLKREMEIKRLSRGQKWALVKGGSSDDAATKVICKNGPIGNTVFSGHTHR